MAFQLCFHLLSSSLACHSWVPFLLSLPPPFLSLSCDLGKYMLVGKNFWYHLISQIISSPFKRWWHDHDICFKFFIIIMSQLCLKDFPYPCCLYVQFVIFLGHNFCSFSPIFLFVKLSNCLPVMCQIRTPTNCMLNGGILERNLKSWG